MPTAEADVQTSRRRISAIWVVPLVAVLLGIWLAVNAWLDKGPTVEISFATASGIVVNKTLVRVLEVDVGVVTDVNISDDLSGVIVTVDLDPIARKFLSTDTEFWVVRPQVSGFNVSGLGTLLSGAYIELTPGVNEQSRVREFVGLDEAPQTPVGTPGIKLQLTSEVSNSVSIGSSILYRGFKVGAVESTELDLQRELVTYGVFIDAPYDDLISSNTRFWNVSGVSAELGAEGVKLNVGSIKTLLEGGIAFGLPENSVRGAPVNPGTEFRLYSNEASTHENPYRHFANYIVKFDQSLRGLRVGAPVTYRGLRIGNVERILSQGLIGLSDEDTEMKDLSIPVLLKIEPGRLSLRDSEDDVIDLQDSIEDAVASGLRATLKSGSILTGSLYVGFDFNPDAEPAVVGNYLGYQTLPTTGSGIELLEVQVNRLLAKLNNLPLEQTLDSAHEALDELKGTLAATRQLVETDEIQQIGATLDEALKNMSTLLLSYSSDSEFHAELTQMINELRFTLDSIQDLTDRLGDNPNQLVFPSDPLADPEPKAAQ
jgi:paraquat-inducible protein B